MRILYVFRSLAIWGGIERILVDKMNYLADKYGYEVFMLTANQGSHSVPYSLSKSVCMEDLNIRFHDQYKYKGIYRLYDICKRYRLFRKRLKERIRTISPNVIVCVADGYHVPITNVKGDIPLIVEAHNNCSFFYKGGGLLKNLMFWYQRIYFPKADMLVTLTKKDADQWKRLSSNVVVIPNLVQLNKSSKYSNLENKRIIFVGRFEEQKRVFDVLSIWKKVYPKFPNWRLDIYGEGGLRSQLEEVSSSLGMNVRIHHPTDKIFDCYRESDLLILTSEYEPFGLVIPEAMSCGLPVVSYNSPYGPETIITDGYDGFIVPLGDKEQFANRLCLLLCDFHLRQEMGRHAIESSQRYSSEEIMPMWKNLFEKYKK